MRMQRFEVPGLAHYSFVLSSEGKAAVIDPRRDVDIYVEYARENGLAITHILETHIHADYASGAVALQNATGAELWLSGHDEGEEFQYKFVHQAFRDGDELLIGDLRIVATHTPGHTPEHLSFLVYERSRCGQPMALFSGDFIFVGSLGRPDLLGEEAKRALAAALYNSVHTKIAGLPDGVEVHPGHGAGSFCGAGMADRPQSTLGYERSCNAFMADTEEREFVQTVLAGVPEFPSYYRRMKRLNADGPPILDGIPGGRGLTPEELQREASQLDATIVDTRRPEAFGGAHIPGAINVGAGQNLSLWSAWMIDYDRPVFLVADDSERLEDARRSLIRVGLDDIRGTLRGGMRSWVARGLEQSRLTQISVLELRALLEQGEPKPFVLDVRSPAEWKAGHIENAVHIPLGSLPERLPELPGDRTVYAICGSGYRSSIAASLLLRKGRQAVVNVAGGMAAWTAQRFLAPAMAGGDRP